MLELDKDRFAQLLREVPEKDVLFPAPQYSPYIQSLIDRLKEEESLDLAAIDWSAFGDGGCYHPLLSGQR